jgi:hypothetical protein
MSSSPAVTDEHHEPTPHPIVGGIRRVGTGTWALLVAAVALVSSVSSLVFTLVPELKPDPRDSVLAQLKVYAVDPDVSLGDYLTGAYGGGTRLPTGLSVATRAQLHGFVGDVVYVRTLVDGFKHRHVRLIWRIYNARTQRVIQSLQATNLPPPLRNLRDVNLDTPSTSTIQLLWISSLDGDEPTFVRIAMYDGKRILAIADSPVIRNNRVPLPQS